MSTYLTDVLQRSSNLLASGHLSPISHSASGSGGQAPAPAGSPAVLLAQVRAVFQRTSFVSERVFELNRTLFPSSAPASPAWSPSGLHFSPLRQMQQQQQSLSYSPKELDAVFEVLVADIFGVSAASLVAPEAQRGLQQAPGGWGLASLNRQRHGRDFVAAFQFLSSAGSLMRCIQTLSADSSCMYEFHLSRLPSTIRPTHIAAAYSPLDGFKSSVDDAKVLVTPFEFYFYNFMSVVSQQGGEWHQNSFMDADSLYPALLEDYLANLLPLGGGFFRFPGHQHHPVAAQAASILQSPSAQTKSSLLRADFSLNRMETLNASARVASPASSPITSSETWKTFTFLDILKKFWLQSHLDGSLPPIDVVKVVRMFIKHLHFFFNSFHPSHAEVKEVLFKGPMADIYDSLFKFFHHLFDHWPLDASFKLVLETWLSYIQPWRYRDAVESDKDGGASFVPGLWDDFLVSNYDFYSCLFRKIVARFLRVDLTSSKNAFMLFRVSRIFGQPGLASALRSVSKNTAASNGTPFIGKTTREDIFDDDFKSNVQELLIRVNDAKRHVRSRRKRLKDREGSGSSGSTLGFIASLFKQEDATVTAELEELDRVLQNLDSARQRLCDLFSLPSEDCVDSVISGNMRDDEDDDDLFSSKLFDEWSPMTPERRWDIINRTGKYSPKSQLCRHPDELPLRSDEIHWLARLLYSLSVLVNKRLPIERLHGRPGLVGTFLRQVCHGETSYRVVNKCSGAADVRVPPRLALRPLASYKFVAYSLMVAAFMYLFGWRSIAKLLFVVFTVWLVRLAFDSSQPRRRE